MDSRIGSFEGSSPGYVLSFTHSLMVSLLGSGQKTLYTSARCNLMAADAAAKSLQSCPTLYDPIDGNPPGSPVPGILQARTLEWVASAFSNVWKWKVKVKTPSPARLFTTPWTTAYQAPRSMGFSRQEYWSGVPLPFLNLMARFFQITRNKYICTLISLVCLVFIYLGRCREKIFSCCRSHPPGGWNIARELGGHSSDQPLLHWK